MEKEQVVVVGGGPAGTACALEMARAGLSVTLVEEAPLDPELMGLDIPYFFGGQVPPRLQDRGAMLQRVLASRPDLARCAEAGVKVLTGTVCWGVFVPGENNTHLGSPQVGLADGERSWLVEFQRLVLATGARDLVLSFPGWELRGVMGAQAFHALLSDYQALPSRRVLFLGSGPLALHLATLALEQGVEVAGVVEAQPQPLAGPALQEALSRRGVPIYTSTVVKEVRGGEEVASALLCRVDSQMHPVPGTEQEVACDTVCLALGLVPNVELAYLAGCRLSFRPELGGWVPALDGDMQTSVPGVFVAGDAGGVYPTAVADPSAARDQGRRVGRAVARSLGLPTGGGEPPVPTPPPAGDADRARGYLRDWLQALMSAGGMGVTVCACEEVTREDLLGVRPPRYLGWRAEQAHTLQSLAQEGPLHPDHLKRLTRAGMGHCQGRRCREQVAMLLALATGRDVSQIPLASYRPPVRPLPMKVLWPREEPVEMRTRWPSWFVRGFRDPME